MGRICASAGLVAATPIAVASNNEQERRVIARNLFISNENPTFQQFNTWVAERPPVATATQWHQIELA